MQLENSEITACFVKNIVAKMNSCFTLKLTQHFTLLYRNKSMNKQFIAILFIICIMRTSIFANAIYSSYTHEKE